MTFDVKNFSELVNAVHELAGTTEHKEIVLFTNDTPNRFRFSGTDVLYVPADERGLAAQ